MNWEKYWSDKSDDGHTDRTPEGIAKEGREKLFHLGSGDRLLDVGCGTGKLLSQYTANFRECIGIERSSTMFAEAQMKPRDTCVYRKPKPGRNHDGVENWLRADRSGELNRTGLRSVLA